MKKLNKIVAVIGMLVIMTITLTGCEMKLGSKNNKVIIDKKELTGYTEYTHSSGVKFSYPEDWTDIGTASNPGFADVNTGTNVNFLSSDIKTVNNLSIYVSASIASIKSELGDKIEGDVLREEVKLNGRDAEIISYKMIQNDIKVNAKQVYFIEDKTAYILTTVTIESEDETEVIDNIISSFMK